MRIEKKRNKEEDGEVIVNYEPELISSSKVMIVDENDFKKKTGSLRKYCKKAYKELCFEFPKRFNKQNGIYKYYLTTSKKFEMVYGKAFIEYETKNGKAMITNIQPSDFLIDGYMKELSTYKGMYYRDLKDKQKIDIVRRIIK